MKIYFLRIAKFQFFFNVILNKDHFQIEKNFNYTEMEKNIILFNYDKKKINSINLDKAISEKSTF